MDEKALEKLNQYKENLHEQEEPEYKGFEVRHHQVLIEIASMLQVTDLLKDDRLNKEMEILTGKQDSDVSVSISKADIVLIYSLYKGGIIEFFDEYMEYVEDCKRKRYKAVNRPHFHLKYKLD